MRFLFAMTALLLVALTSTASAQTCDFSGAPVRPSEARTMLRVRDGGMIRTHNFGGPAHSFYYVQDIYGANADIESVAVADFDALQNGRSRMIDGETAWFLWDVDVAPEGTQADPPVVAFSNRTAAERWQGELGGEIVQGWDGIWSRFNSAYSDMGGDMGDRRRHVEYER